MKTWFLIILLLFAFLIGTLFGITYGTQMVIAKIAYMGANVFAGSNINIDLKFNESNFMNEFNKTIVPELNKVRDRPIFSP